jgi:hypothetical protein
MKKFLKNQRELIALAAFLIVVSLLGYFVVKPLFSKIVITKNDIEEVAIKQDIKKQRLNELPRISQQYAEISDQKDKTDILLDKQQAVVLIERLEKLAQETNNKISISIQGDVPQQKNSSASSNARNNPEATALIDALPSKDYLKLRISLLGDYNGIFGFINKLENLEYYSDITGININHETQSELSSSGTGNFDVSNSFETKSSSAKNNTGKNAMNGGYGLAAFLDVVFYSKN